MNARRPEAGGVGRGGAPKVRPETKMGDDGLRKTAGLALGFVPGRRVRAVHPVRTAYVTGQRGGGTQTVSGMGAGAPAAPPLSLTDAQGRGQRRQEVPEPGGRACGDASRAYTAAPCAASAPILRKRRGHVSGHK